MGALLPLPDLADRGERPRRRRGGDALDLHRRLQQRAPRLAVVPRPHPAASRSSWSVTRRARRSSSTSSPPSSTTNPPYCAASSSRSSWAATSRSRRARRSAPPSPRSRCAPPPPRRAARSPSPPTPPSRRRDSVFGRPGQGVSLQSGQTAKAGQQVACVNPAALSGGTADLEPLPAHGHPDHPAPGTPAADRTCLHPLGHLPRPLFGDLRTRRRGHLAPGHQPRRDAATPGPS